MWNYSFILPTAMIFLILVIFYFRRPRLPVRMNRTFLALLLVDILTLFLDYTSTVADEQYTRYSLFTCYALNMAFFVFFLARTYCFFRFILDVIESRSELPHWIRRLSPAVVILAELTALSSPLTHAVFYMDGEGYHSGPWYNILYICFFFYLAAETILILYQRRRLPKELRISLLCVVLILTAGNIIRIVAKGLLVMNTFCLMAILVIYLGFENPDLYLTYRGNAFNLRAFKILLREWCRKDSFRILSFAIRNYNEMCGIYSGGAMDKAVGRINDYLAGQYTDCVVFYLQNGCFALAGPKTMDTGRISGEISECLIKPCDTIGTDIVLKPVFVETSVEKRQTTPERILSVLLVALENAAGAGYAEDTAASVSAQDIDRYLQEKHALDKALEKDEVEIYLQPIVSSRDRQLIGAEALARIRTEDGTVLSPASFIPLAEKDGSIIELGEQVLRKTCRFISSGSMSVLGMQWINVNISPYQCMNRNTASSFQKILREYGVSPVNIHLELTEQTIQDYFLVGRQLTELQELGFQFALDDYGSGSSNLIRVKKYPFKNIKIDMEVVWGYFRDRDRILPTMVQIFRQMGFSITAEGIETEEMADVMTEMGCDFLQGYYFSRPLPEEEFKKRYA